jgi:tetratricopeptide (TPR) repeat protein
MSSPAVLWLLAHGSGRVFDYRISGSTYQPTVNQRGPTKSEGPTYLFAKFIIAIRDNLGAGGSGWQRVHGREALLEGGSANIETAVDSLSLAFLAVPQDTSVANDLAVALLRRASSDASTDQSRVEDVGRAIKTLDSALKLRQDATLYFNLALAYEQLQTYAEALTNWDAFLKLESSGGWADEAREHIKTIRARQQGRSNGRVRRSEDKIFELAASGFRSTSEFDLASIAEDMATNHDDPWLEDLMSANRKSGDRGGFEQLTDGVRALNRNNWTAAENSLRRALPTLVKSGNRPATVFASYELAYALQRLGEPHQCIGVAKSVFPEVVERHYHWLEIQLGVTLGLCQGLARDFDSCYRAIEAAHLSAVKAQYSSRELYTLGMASGVLREVGSYREALSLDSTSIRRYWQG